MNLSSVNNAGIFALQNLISMGKKVVERKNVDQKVLRLLLIFTGLVITLGVLNLLDVFSF